MQSLSALLVVILGTVGWSFAQEYICTDDQLREFDSNVVKSRADNETINGNGAPAIHLEYECADGFYQPEDAKYCLRCAENGYDFEGCNEKLCEKICEFDIENPPPFGKHVSQMGLVSGNPAMECKNGYNQTYCSYDLTCTDGEFTSDCPALCEEPTYSACDISQLDNVVSIDMQTVKCAEGYKTTTCASRVICDSTTNEWIRDFYFLDWIKREKIIHTCAELCEKTCTTDERVPNLVGINADGYPECAVGYETEPDFNVIAPNIVCNENGTYELELTGGVFRDPCVETCKAEKIKEMHENVVEVQPNRNSPLVTCEEGFMSVVSCLTCDKKSNEWKHNPEMCEENRVCYPECKASDLPKNFTNIAGVDTRPGKYTGYTFVDIICEDDYVLVNHAPIDLDNQFGDSVKCADCTGGKWEISAECDQVCHKKCTLEGAASLAWAANVKSVEYIENNVQFTCEDGFKPNEDGCNAECNSMGNWAGPSPVFCATDTVSNACVKTCSLSKLQEKYPQVESMTTFDNDDSVDVTCTGGFQTSIYVPECLKCKEDATWSDTCKSVCVPY